MKRLSILLIIALMTASLTGCGNGDGGNLKPNKKVIKWFKENVDYFICAKGKQPSLYYFGEVAYSRYNKFVKINLKTYEKEVVKTLYNEKGDKEYKVNNVEVILPEKKGYDGKTHFTVVSITHAFIYNAKKGFVEKEICSTKGDLPLKTYGGIIACSVPSQDKYPVITDVVIYDSEGNELEPKKYEGSFAGKQVIVELYEKNGILLGSYYQLKHGPNKHRLFLEGGIDNNRAFTLYSYTQNGCPADKLTGTLKDGKIEGKHKLAYGHRNTNFTLTEVK